MLIYETSIELINKRGGTEIADDIDQDQIMHSLRFVVYGNWMLSYATVMNGKTLPYCKTDGADSSVV